MRLAEIANTSTPEVFLVGPLRPGDFEHRHAFACAASTLRLQGIPVFSPVEFTQENDHLDTRSLMEAVVGRLLESDAVVTLPGWECSPGAQVHVTTASALRIPVVALDDLAPEVLATA